MASVWKFEPAKGTFALVGGTRAMRLNRCLTDNGRTRLGGGLMRFEEDDELGPWTVSYDEVFYVMQGELRIVTNDEELRLGAGAVGLIAQGTTVTYIGTRETEAFYVVSPRDWEADAEPLELGE